MQSHKTGNIKNSKTAIGKSIKKHGWDKFEVECIDFIREQLNKDNDNYDHFHNLLLNQLEIYYIKFHKSFGKKGYNLTTGGEGCSGHLKSDETLEKLSKSLTGLKRSPETLKKLKIAANRRANDPNWIAKISTPKKAGTGEKMSKIFSDGRRAGENNTMFGTTRPEVSEKNKQIKSKAVMCIETGEIFYSGRECARKLGLGPGNLVAHLRGSKTNKTVKGLTFRFVDIK